MGDTPVTPHTRQLVGQPGPVEIPGLWGLPGDCCFVLLMTVGTVDDIGAGMRIMAAGTVHIAAIEVVDALLVLSCDQICVAHPTDAWLGIQCQHRIDLGVNHVAVDTSRACVVVGTTHPVRTQMVFMAGQAPAVSTIGRLVRPESHRRGR